MRTYLVGKSLVSAITQTPASGPFAPVTTPPISSALTWAAGCALAPVGTAMNNEVPKRLAANVLRYDLCVMLMPRSFSDAIQPAGIGKVYHSAACESN